MLWTTSSMLLILGLLGFSYRRLVALRALSRMAEPYLERGRALAARAPASSDQRRYEMAELNEATIEIGQGLERPGFVATSSAKAAFSIGALSALLQSIHVLQGRGSWGLPLLSFVAGCGGAVGCRIIGRLAEERAQRLREEWSGLIRRFARDVAT